MIQVTLRLRSFLRYVLGKPELTLTLEDGSTVIEAVNKFANENGDKIKEHIFDRKTGKCNALFVVNKCQVPMEYILKDKDELTNLPPLAGG